MASNNKPDEKVNLAININNLTTTYDCDIVHDCASLHKGQHNSKKYESSPSHFAVNGWFSQENCEW